MLSAAVVCRVRWPNQRELSRKIVHIGTGPVIPLAWWLGIPSNWAIPMAILITIVILINHRWRLLPAIEDVNRNSYGTVAYALTITLLLIFFWPENAAAVCSGVLVMAFGDGLAGLIGRKVRSPNWLIWGQRKSIAGTLTMAVITLIILFTLSLLIDASFHPLRIFAVTGLAVGLEQLSRWGIDNLTVPMGVAVAWSWMTAI
ncbi:diacylglycerol/polyprenol kinase family protein [Prochlorococcus sp. MIT 1306]|uniref:diacylglycerol/polyprenol kinase family protein n=1 Tax=Prochlorococcus sp. MIT 1306 TaxID=1799667 RepID=UPI001E34D440|nr:diacylglycerol/polyprenol kinase family protein [Prochlorococcus sp. MIT 1306]MED5165419.1 SEC59/DGK1/VTE5 family protein [Cyanobacteriota bacterium]